ncbi:MAG: FCD domain-containing protein [Pseudomonadota bacterium]
MPFEKIQPEKLSGGVVRQIELLILEGILRPGERLPAERELAERMGVSRPSLREAVADLQTKGLLTAKAGSGIYVADVLTSAFSPALASLFAEHDRAKLDVLSFRRDIEGLAAERAARQGSDTDLAVIAEIFAKMENAHGAGDAEAEAALDAEFHLAIIEASHNVIMIHMMRSMYDLLHQGVFFNRQIMFRHKTTADTLLDQHKSINAALQARDGARARAALEDHIEYVETQVSDHRRAEDNEHAARRRLEHEKSR